MDSDLKLFNLAKKLLLNHDPEILVEGFRDVLYRGTDKRKVEIARSRAESIVHNALARQMHNLSKAYLPQLESPPS